MSLERRSQGRCRRDAIYLLKPRVRVDSPRIETGGGMRGGQMLDRVNFFQDALLRRNGFILLLLLRFLEEFLEEHVAPRLPLFHASEEDLFEFSK